MSRSVQFIVGVIAVVVALAAGFYGRNLYLKEVSTYQVSVPISTILHARLSLRICSKIAFP